MAIRYFLVEIDDVDEASMREYATPEECKENATMRNSSVAGPFMIVLSETGAHGPVSIDFISIDDDDDDDG